MTGIKRVGAVAAALVMLCGLLTACYPAGSVLVGTITFTDGAAAGNVDVAAYAQTTDATPIVQVTSDIHGAFAIAGSSLPDGASYIRVGSDWWTGHGLSTDPADAVSVTTSASESPTEIDVQVPIVGTISGTLVDAAQQAIANRLIWLQEADGTVDSQTTTGSTGAFSLDLARPGDVQLVVLDPVSHHLTKIGKSSYAVTEGAHLDAGTIAVLLTPPPLDLLGTQNFIGGDATNFADQPGLIRPDMNPGYWASIEAPATLSANGDLYNTHSSTNPNYDPNGQIYTLQVTATTPYLFIQVFDAGFDSSAGRSVTGDGPLGTVAPWTTSYQLLASDSTPNDMTDNPVVSEGTCGGGTGNDDNSGQWSIAAGTASAPTAFKNRWRTLCTLSNPTPTAPGAPLLLRVSTASDGVQGNAVNDYALRAVAATSPSLDANGYPVAPSDAASQPRLSAHADAVLTTPYGGGSQNDIYPLVNVSPAFAGHTLVIDLFDIGDVNDTQYVTLNTPTGPQLGCSTSTVTVGGTVSNVATIADGTPCQIKTASFQGSLFNNRTLSIQVTIPADYSCDEAQNPNPIDASFAANGCWWSLHVSTVGYGFDITSWAAHVL